jgi:drug/metabolite transporter (DMT)-like permease
MNSILGVSAALASAILWAISSPMLSAPVHRYGAPAVNLYKSVVSTLLFFATMAAVLGAGALGRASDALPWFGLSGLVGLAIGDTAYFVSLRALGPSLALIIYQLSSVFGVVLGVVFRGERPGAMQLVGTALVVGGVAYATWTRADDPARGKRTAEARRLHLVGVAGGLLSALCQAVGLLINKRAWDVAVVAGFEKTEVSSSTLAATARMGATAIGLLLAVAVVGRFRQDTLPLREREGWRITWLPAVLGTYLGILSMQVAVANLDLGVASTLLGTSPIFVIPVAWLLIGERPTVRKTLGALIATGGVALISLAR